MSQTTSSLTKAVTELVAIGAAIASNCEPCVRHHLEAAHKLGVSKQDMREAVQVALTVKATPHRKVVEAADRFLAMPGAGTSEKGEGCGCDSAGCC